MATQGKEYRESSTAMACSLERVVRRSVWAVVPPLRRGAR